ncbi:CSS-motif domain-containing protein [Pantoea anthophila]|uniref:CSS-motif domain-containing protein n=1 Tax=Pantoea anthophila TaxID=470931 RepID=UPI0028A2D29F|nr:CSS-motif domain-containing protein [Pantoea anthophila]
MPLLKRKRDYARLVIIISGLLPLVIGLFFTALDARHTVHQQQMSAAETLLSQAERMSDSAWNMITELRQFDQVPCSQIENQLQRIGSLNPYFRAIGKMEQGKIACSSVYGSRPAPLKAMILRDAPVTGKAWWSLSIAGTAGVPTRPAVILCAPSAAPIATISAWISVMVRPSPMAIRKLPPTAGSNRRFIRHPPSAIR